ncbi:MAG: nitrilase-related carbon-nitrogen hydrolase, partial [Pseudomonadota bacterium]|nr:nitrilase-related carbon-nitrogen hydrolase [Pseudomonadota bacterium]
MNAVLRTTLAQINPVVGDLSGNAARIITLAKQYAEETDIVVFPELVLCGYPPEDLVLKPFFLERCETALDSLVKASADIDVALIVSAPEADGK